MENFILNALPSIRESISVRNREPPPNPTIEETDSDDDSYHYDSADEGFSFGISATNSCNKTTDRTADEIFHHGHIIPLYSVPNRTTYMDDTDTDASPIQRDAADEIYDMPKTAPGSPMKSWSTGSTRRRNPIHEFFFGGRSRSDGNEKLGFVEKGNGSVKGKKKKDKGKEKRKEQKDSKKTDHTKNGERGIIVKRKEKDMLARSRRRSFLPYIGVFGGGPMHEFTKKLFF